MPDTLRLRFASFELDERQARLMRGGRALALPPKAFAVLCVLARQPGQLVRKDELLDAVWGHQYVSDSVLKTTISELRAVLGDDAKQPRYIETASRRGYRFIASWQPADEAPPIRVAPTPATGVATTTPDEPLFVGRTAALAQLRAAWDHALGGRRQLTWIAGEAGIGKTMLIDRFAAELKPVVLAHGQCLEQFGAGEPYLPVLEALASLCRRDPRAVELVRSVAPTWLLQLPWLSDAAQRESLERELAGIGQERMLRELAELLDRYTEQQPLLLVTEDLHWSDHATVRLIDAVARRRDAARLLWLGSFRPAELISSEHPLNGLRHELRARRLCNEIALDPFSESEVGAIVAERWPHAAPSDHFVRTVHRHTDGLPLFVANVVDELAAQGIIDLAGVDALGGPAARPWPVPESLSGTIERRLAGLGAEPRSVLEAACVCGVEFRAATVAEVLGRPASWIAAQCDLLVRQRLWLRAVSAGERPDGSLDAVYAFHHAVYRDVLYNRLGALTRVAWHREIASSIERGRAAGVSASAAEIASHHERGLEPIDAVRHYVQAADDALSRFAPTEALRLAGHALSLLPGAADASEQLELELALQSRRGIASAQLYGVTSPQVKQALERGQALCERRPHSRERAWMLSGLGWVHYARGDYAAACAHADYVESLALADDDAVLLVCACCLRGSTMLYQGEFDEARRSLERGITLCESAADRLAGVPLLVDPLVVMLGNLCLVLQHLGLADQARQRSRQALDRAQQIGQLNAREMARRCAAVLADRLGDHAAAGEHASVLGELVDKHAFAQGAGPAHWMRGITLARSGDPVAGCALIVEGWDINQRLGMYYAGTRALCYAAQAMMLAGDAAAAQAHADAGLALAERLGERLCVPDLWLLRARIALARGDGAAARDALRESLRQAAARRALDQVLNALVELCALEPAAESDRDALADLCAQLSEGADTPVMMRARSLLNARRHAAT